MSKTKVWGTLAVAAVLGATMVACEPGAEGNDGAASESNITNACITCRLVLHRSICGVTDGMTEDEVREVLGEPKGATTMEGTFGEPIPASDYGDMQISFFRFDGAKRVAMVGTNSKNTRSAKGFGVGSTEAELKEKIPGLECRQFDNGRACRIGQGGQILPGGRMTIFEIKDGVVTALRFTRGEG